MRLAILLASQHRFDEIAPTLDAMVAALPLPRTMLLAAETLDRLGNREDAETWRRRARAAAADLPASARAASAAPGR